MNGNTKSSFCLEENAAPKTLVVLDLETTGFYSPEITELALISVPYANMRNLDFVRRAQNNLVLCFNPRRQIIDPVAEQMTKLNKKVLNNFSHFDDKGVSLLKSFFDRLERPVVVVAHNGFAFDFPILKNLMLEICAQNEYKDFFLNLTDVRLMDSWIFFKEQDAKRSSVVEHEESPSSKLRRITLESPSKEHQLDNGTEEPCQMCQSSAEDKSDFGSECLCSDASISEGPSNSELRDFCISQEEELVKTPTKNWANRSSSEVKRPQGYFKLENIFERTFDRKPQESHSALADCSALLELLSFHFLDVDAAISSFLCNPHSKSRAILSFSKIPHYSR